MLIDIICDGCGVTFKRDDREVKRSKKEGRKNYHNRACSSRHNMQHLVSYSGLNTSGLRRGGVKTPLTPFKPFVRSIHKRQGSLNDITVEFIKELWEKQKGKCVYTGISLILPSSRKANSKIYTASLDRIDSHKEYQQDNVQFVSMAINFMKNDMLESEVFELLNIIRNSKGS